MSHIPESAVPHAKASTADSTPDAPTGAAQTFSERANAAVGQASETVKANPKAAIAIGATLVAGVAAALAAPSVFARTKTDGKKKSAAKKGK